MRPPLFFLALLSCLTFNALAAEPPVESCEQLRAQIGQLPPANHELLAKMSLRKDCKFTSAEVYKVAYGDKPPPRETREHQRHREDYDD